MNKFIPNMYQESIYKINYNKIKEKNIKCLLFDLDNTCVGYKIKDPTKELSDLLKKLTTEKFQVIIFTNARKKRIEPFKILNVDINYLSKKPLKSSFKKILKKYNYQKEEVIIIGDQLFTDIYGGNRIGIYTCLVDPLTTEDFFFTKITRNFENAIFKKLERKKILTRGKYYK